ncbi:hypothetical protein E6B08_17615 [Pseudomonas putida]|uniref:Uncharacterized protein n=1 Tax=Pseudomonas putida TaxID=303 RepID=A0A4D6X8T3_PSEPU|nr:hypothetical protein [Pseudomonas putida]QCI13076.1 hypothetical protein E6B08_17615 [Pseudomonas putida]
MKERTILFNTHMVRAIQEGRKHATRFAVTGAAAKWLIDQSPEWVADHAGALCKLGQPGDRLWVREDTEAYLSPCESVMLSRYVVDKQPVLYAGRENPRFNGSVAHWDYPSNLRPAARMPHFARRILLEITAVRVERLQSISDEHCVAEGIIPVAKNNPDDPHERQFWRDYHLGGDGTFCVPTPRNSFQTLWRHNNGWSFPCGAALEATAPHRWAANPWVWVLEFSRIDASQQASAGLAA